MDGRSHSDYFLQNTAEALAERRRRGGLAAEPTLVLVSLIPMRVSWWLAKRLWRATRTVVRR